MTEQVKTRPITTASIMRRLAFQRGVEDVRTGLAPQFDENLGDDASRYERGRLFARIAPPAMPIKIGGKLNPKAIALFDVAYDRGLII